MTWWLDAFMAVAVFVGAAMEAAALWGPPLIAGAALLATLHYGQAPDTSGQRPDIPPDWPDTPPDDPT
ncbi:hypothetical protein ACH4Q7_22395 [Streptomyces roseolus]|uniref:hypothetical protein n=1 Tax=Streptomyces roseolus TaxID=67358 RepID=UPI0037BC2A9E